MLMMGYLIIMILIYSFIGYRYYVYQNSTQTIGGPISKAKITWLTYTTFFYFIGSVFVYLTSDICLFHLQLFIFILLIYFRALAQMLLMFLFKKWIPPMGMVYNILCFCVVWGTAFYKGFSGLIVNAYTSPTLMYIIILSLALLTDTYYAYLFYKIVSSATTGSNAIWYASESDKKFARINKITSNLNRLYLFLLLLFILSYGHAHLL